MKFFFKMYLHIKFFDIVFEVSVIFTLVLYAQDLEKAS